MFDCLKMPYLLYIVESVTVIPLSFNNVLFNLYKQIKMSSMRLRLQFIAYFFDNINHGWFIF